MVPPGTLPLTPPPIQKMVGLSIPDTMLRCIPQRGCIQQPKGMPSFGAADDLRKVGRNVLFSCPLISPPVLFVLSGGSLLGMNNLRLFLIRTALSALYNFTDGGHSVLPSLGCSTAGGMMWTTVFHNTQKRITTPVLMCGCCVLRVPSPPPPQRQLLNTGASILFKTTILFAC
jgi:hypothetical protein